MVVKISISSFRLKHPFWGLLSPKSGLLENDCTICPLAALASIPLNKILLSVYIDHSANYSLCVLNLYFASKKLTKNEFKNVTQNSNDFDKMCVKNRLGEQFCYTQPIPQKCALYYILCRYISLKADE